MLVPNRHGSSNSYRYGFQGQEKDDEIKGEGNSYDFGARMLDPRVGRWFAPDKMENSLPYFSPYIFVNNNPNIFVDPDGNFLIDVHKRITSRAFDRSRIIQTTKNYKVIENYRRAIVGYGIFDGSVVAPDHRSLPKPIGFGKTSIHTQHFDNMNYQKVITNFDKINKGVKDMISLYSRDVVDEKQLGAVVGEYMHAIQDFYSHSNYIEIYEKVYGETDLSKIPTLQEAMSSKEHKKFAQLLKKELKTGTYPGKGKGSHKDMNHDLGEGSNMVYENLEEVKDKKVDWNSRAAEAVATKATIELNDKIESNLKTEEKK